MLCSFFCHINAQLLPSYVAPSHPLPAHNRQHHPVHRPPPHRPPLPPRRHHTTSALNTTHPTTLPSPSPPTLPTSRSHHGSTHQEPRSCNNSPQHAHTPRHTHPSQWNRRLSDSDDVPGTRNVPINDVIVGLPRIRPTHDVRRTPSQAGISCHPDSIQNPTQCSRIGRHRTAAGFAQQRQRQ